MDRSPTILVVTNEPMLMVNMLSELEDRGFAVKPMKPGEHTKYSHPNGIDAGIFDLHWPDENLLRFASKLRRSAIPIVTLGNGSSFNSVRIAGARPFLSKPVDYDRLAELLFELPSRPLAVASHTGVGRFHHMDAIRADDR